MATTGGKKRALVHFSSQICNAVLKRDPQQCTKYNYQVLHKQMREKVGLLAPYPKCLKRVIKRSRRLLVPTKSVVQANAEGLKQMLLVRKFQGVNLPSCDCAATIYSEILGEGLAYGFWQ